MQAQLLRIQVLILRAQQIDIAACGLFGRLFSAPAGKRNLLGIQGQIFCKTGQGDRRCLLQKHTGDTLFAQLLRGLFIQLPLCGVGNNDLRTGTGDQLVLRRRFCKGPCVDCLRQLRFIDRSIKQPPVVFPDVLRVMDGKRRIHFLYCDRSIVVPVVRIRYTAVLRAKYDHLPHRIAAVPVAASGSLNDGIQRSQRAIQRFKVKVYPSLDALGRHDPAGQLLLQPLTDDLNLPAPVRGAQVRGKKENRVFGAKP